MPAWKKWTLGIGAPVIIGATVAAGVFAVPVLGATLGITAAGPVAGGAFAGA